MTFQQVFSSIKTFNFEPTLANEDEIKLFLTLGKGAEQVAHPYNDEILFNDKGVIRKIRKTVHPSFFLTSTDIQRVEKVLTSMFPYSGCPELATYSIDILFTGSKIKTPITNGKVSIVAISDKSHGSYFDLVAYFNSQNINYSQRTSITCPLNHSGDYLGHGNNNRLILTHSISVKDTKADNFEFVVGAVGFNTTPLKQFTSQNPVIMIVNHETNVVTIIPCPLDESSVGNATLTLLTHCKIVKEDGNLFLVTTVIQPLIFNNINTGENSSQIASSIHSLHELPEVHHEAAVSSQESAKPNLTSNPKPNLTETKSCPLIEFSDNQHIEQIVKDSTKILFHNGIGTLNDSTIPKIPCIFGSCAGHPSVMLGASYQGEFPPDQYYSIINKSHVVVHLTTTNWNFFTSTTCKMYGNCIFIVHATDKEMTDFAKVNLYFYQMLKIIQKDFMLKK